MATHTFATKQSPVSLAALDEALQEAARRLPYYPLSINDQTGVSYTLVLTDGTPNVIVRRTSSSPNTVTVPAYASVAFPLGTLITVDQWGTGKTSILGALGVTLRCADVTTPAARTQFSRLFLQKLGTDEWLIFGDLDVYGDSP